MNWNKLLSAARYGKGVSQPHDTEVIRTEFQRDYDRLIFSSPFRRLQNKTQVFPLPGSVFVHNRLTHSLEVASVGRSLGNLVSKELKKTVQIKNIEILDEIGSVVAAASLSHDMGNPPFGHSGEEAISSFFTSENGIRFKELIADDNQWNDLISFEGNANALRLLTHKFNGRRNGGFVLTYATLASLIKYPFSSTDRTKKNKYGYFNTEKETFLNIAKTTGLIPHQTIKDAFCRHPLVYLVEAADDISYQIMDIEDAHKLGIFTTDQTKDIFMAFFDKIEDAWFYQKTDEIYQDVTDANEQIAFLRASVINHLVTKCADIFIRNQKAIMEGVFEKSLVDYLMGSALEASKHCGKIAFEKVYKHRSVVGVEITGYNVLNTLLNEFTQAVFEPNKKYSQRLLSLLPMQYNEKHSSNYDKLRSVLDFVSGMTDLYAMELYNLIKGIGI